MLSSLLLVAAIISQTLQWETDIGYLPFSSPLLAVNDDGSMDIFVAMGDHGLGAWNADGNLLAGFPVSVENGVSRRPAALGSVETGRVIVYADNAGMVHMLDHAGLEKPGWPYQTESQVVTGVSIVNLDENRELEIAFGTSDGTVHLLDTSGRPVPGWPVNLPARLLWQPSQLSLGGNSGLGLVCGLSNMKVLVLTHSGGILPGWPVSTGFSLGSVPVTADIDSDGLADVIFSTNDNRVYAVNSSGQVIEGWPFFLDDRVSGGSIAIGLLDSEAGNLHVAVSTVDGNVTLLRGSGRIAGTWRWPNLTRGVPTSPVIFSTRGGPAVAVGCDSGYVYAWNARGEAIRGFPLRTGQPVSRTPAAGDINGDGNMHLVIMGRSGRLSCYSMSGGRGADASWPQILCDGMNSGSYGTSHLPVVQAGSIPPEVAGSVTLPYTVVAGRAESVALAYSTNSGYTWTGTSSFEDDGNSVTWFSHLDLPGLDAGECVLRVTPLGPSGSGISGVSGIFRLDNNAPPVIRLSILEEESRGRFLIFYTVEDRENDPINLQAQYSMDGGETWRSAGLSGSTFEIPPWLYGEPVRWDASAIPGHDEQEAVLFRIRAVDADPGPWSQVTLTEGLETPSVAQILVPSEEVSGRVVLGVRLAEPKNDPLDCTWEFSLDGGSSWEEATVPESRTPFTGSYQYEIIWDSMEDIPGLDATGVRFRVLPPDSGQGVSVPSAPFHVDNNTPPSLRVTFPGRWDHFRGSVPVHFEISDQEGDSISMLLEYRIEGTSAWVPASGLIPSGYYPHSTYRSSLTWNSSEDLPGTESLELRIRVGATDGDTVFTDVIGPLSIDNSRLPSVMQAALRDISRASGRADISYELSDPEERRLDLVVVFSTDGGGSWKDASVSGDLLERHSGIYQGRFAWDFGDDLSGVTPPGPDRRALLKLIPVSGQLMGTPKILELDLR